VEGQLGYTEAGGYVICEGGKWVSADPTAVDHLINGYSSSTSGTWSEYYQVNKPDTSFTLASTWGGNTVKIGNKDYVWSVYRICNQLNKENSDEIRFSLNELHDLKRGVILTCDTVSVIGDFISLAGCPPIGDPISILSSSVGYGISINEYLKGHITEDQMMRIHISYFGGLAPGWGTGFDIYQSWIDFTGR
jgi:hypothetical protein